MDFILLGVSAAETRELVHTRDSSDYAQATTYQRDSLARATTSTLMFAVDNFRAGRGSKCYFNATIPGLVRTLKETAMTVEERRKAAFLADDQKAADALPKHERMPPAAIYEHLTDNSPVRLYIDIDGEGITGEPAETIESLCLMAERHLGAFIDALDIDVDARFAWASATCTTTDPAKLSLHLVVTLTERETGREIAFYDTASVGAFMRRFFYWCEAAGDGYDPRSTTRVESPVEDNEMLRTRINGISNVPLADLLSKIDWGVYTKNRVFRTLLSRKFRQDRPTPIHYMLRPFAFAEGKVDQLAYTANTNAIVAEVSRLVKELTAAKIEPYLVRGIHYSTQGTRLVRFASPHTGEYGVTSSAFREGVAVAKFTRSSKARGSSSSSGSGGRQLHRMSASMKILTEFGRLCKPLKRLTRASVNETTGDIIVSTNWGNTSDAPCPFKGSHHRSNTLYVIAQRRPAMLKVRCYDRDCKGEQTFVIDNHRDRYDKVFQV